MVKKNFENGEASLVDLEITSGDSDPSPDLRDSGFQNEASVRIGRNSGLQLLQVLDNLRAGPVHCQDKLAANHAVAIDDGGFRITRGPIKVVAVFC
jgi:hypothetical protein